MGISISNPLAALSDAAANFQRNEPAPQTVQQAANQPTDTVTLTAAQQVYQLYNQGHTISQIAFSLRLSVAAVNSYLGLSNTSSRVA